MPQALSKQPNNMPENPMGTAPIWPLLLKMAWPAILSMTINALYNVVDSIFVGMISEEALTAVSIINPMQLFIISIAFGSGVGIKSLVSRSLGAKDYRKANLASTTGILMALFNGALWVIFTAFFAEDFVHMYFQDGFIEENALIYMKICCYCAVFINFQIIAQNTFQATGNMITAMYIDLTGAIVNLILDPILIFGLLGNEPLGVEGAAIATVTGQCVCMILSLIILFKAKNRVDISFKGYKIDWKVIKEIYQVGFPTMIMQAILPILIFAYNWLLAGISEIAVAVLGVYAKLESFVFMPVFGLMQGTLPILGYNYGARNRERMLEVRKDAMILAIILLGTGTLVFQIFPEQLMAMFSAGEEMTELGVPALRIISICFIPAAYGITTSSAFQAMGYGYHSLICSLIRQLVFILPLAYILIQIGGVTLSWLSFPLAEISGFVYCFFVFKYLRRTKIDTLEQRG